MAMDFWARQQHMRRQTFIYLTLFAIMTIGVAAFAEGMIRWGDPNPFDDPIPFVGGAFLAITVGAAGWNYLMLRSQGGGYVAKLHGGTQVHAKDSNPKHQRLYNIVHEMAIASGQPIPEVYVLKAKAINAFAAGMRPESAAIAVTEGAIDKLSRDELQAVVAHEFGHIANADMLLSLRIATMVTGFYVVLYLGMRILFHSGRSRGSGKGKGQVAIVALILMAAGAVAWFAGSILKATVSRRREYLADASAVQFTRDSLPLSRALAKIREDHTRDMPKEGGAYSHMYFDNRGVWGALFATHPPIEKRIAVLRAEAQPGGNREDAVSSAS